MRFVAELLSAVIIVGTLWSFWAGFKESREDRINRAWTLIAAAKENTGNIGLVDALHTLRGYKITDFSRLTLPGAYPYEITLPKLILEKADLSKADMSRANLSEADLSGAAGYTKP